MTSTHAVQKTIVANMISEQVDRFIADCIKQFDSIAEERILLLENIIQFIQSRTGDNSVDLTFICTHNSRRSHLSQVWAQVAATYYKLNNINCYSGGTEATAIFPLIIETIKENGLTVNKSGDSDNPTYEVLYSAQMKPIIGFSKVFDDSFNPSFGFAAIMTCTDADLNCPIISQAAQRISLPYEDPKKFDNSPEQKKMYLERSREIATELFYVMSKIK